jgi:Holliday junction resolvase RusA-like endonuclease
MKRTLIINGYRSIPCKKNNIIISYRRKKAYPNKKVKEFKSYMQEVASEAVSDYYPFWNILKSYEIEIDVTYGGAEIDIQNVFDIICDSLEGIAYENDSQIKTCKATKRYEKNTWIFQIRLTEI